VVAEGFNNTDSLLKNPTLAPTCTFLSPRVKPVEVRVSHCITRNYDYKLN
jgi:hypothetical protein